MAIDPATGKEAVEIAAPTNWLPATGLDAEVIGHIQNKGWDKKTPAEAAIEAAKSHREAERMLGGGIDNLVRIPKDATDTVGWGVVYNKLGAPKDVKDYDPSFTGVKFKDGTVADEAFIAPIKKYAVDHHLSIAATSDLVKELVGIVDNADAEEATINSQKASQEVAKLEANWGKPNMEVNKLIAANAVKKLGIDPAAVEALQGKIGYAAVMTMFHTIGTKIGEDSFVKSLGGDGSPVLTVEQSKARLQELKADGDWSKRLMSGDVRANAEFVALTTIIANAV